MSGDRPDLKLGELTVQQLLAFEAECRETSPHRRLEQARKRLGIKPTRYQQMLMRLYPRSSSHRPELLRRALELDPITTNRMLARLDQEYRKRERLAGRGDR